MNAPAGYVLPCLGHEPCAWCGEPAPVFARADLPQYRETVCSCTEGHTLGLCDVCGCQLVPADQSGKRCATCADEIYVATGQVS